MAYVSTVIHDGTGVLRTGSGVVTGMDMLAAAQGTRDWAIDWSRITHFILDLEAVTKFQVSSAEIQAIVAVNKEDADLLAGVRLLAVAAPEDVQFGMVRMFAAYNRLPNLEVRIFRTMAELQASVDPDGIFQS